MRVGTAGWSIPRDAACAFPGDGRHVNRYAKVLTCAEINSSFYRSHRAEVYERWAQQTPPDFRFSVKLPRAITHDARLRRARVPLRRFLAEAAGLGERFAVVLVQLPPSFAFEARVARTFFGMLGDLFEGAVVCEPRHASWLTKSADRVLVDLRVGRVAADPARWLEASIPGGWLGRRGDGCDAVIYHRWHGTPRVYWSRYETAWLRDRVVELKQWPTGCDRWCIFDNTASGAAMTNALELQALLSASS